MGWTGADPPTCKHHARMIGLSERLQEKMSADGGPFFEASPHGLNEWGVGPGAKSPRSQTQVTIQELGLRLMDARVLNLQGLGSRNSDDAGEVGSVRVRRAAHWLQHGRQVSRVRVLGEKRQSLLVVY